MRKYVYELEKEIAQSIGFVIPKNNVIITREKRDWGYNPKTKCIYTSDPRVTKLDTKKAEIDFAVAHEFTHLIQNFVLKNKRKFKRFSLKKYEKMLQKFFKNKKICVSYMQFYKFKNFINSSIYNNDEVLKVLCFDEKYYVSSTKLLEILPAKVKIYMPLYTENTMEITANAFAARYVHKKYINEKQSKKLLLELSEIIRNQLKQLRTISKPRSKKNFVKQMNISRCGENYTFFKAIIEMLNPMTNYSFYNFDKVSKIMHRCVKDMESVMYQGYKFGNNK